MTDREKTDMLFFKSGYMELERKYRELVYDVCGNDPRRTDHAAVIRLAKISKAYYNRDYGDDDTGEVDAAIKFLHTIDVENATLREAAKENGE